MRRAIAALIVLAMTSCESARFTSEGDDPREPLAPGCSVAVLNEVPDERAFEELGRCSVNGPQGAPLDSRDIERLRRCACQGGGNAILLPADGTSSRTVKVIWILSGTIDRE